MGTKTAQTAQTTEQVVQKMMTENTGRALCDSGGAYGRNWERNQGRNFGESKTGIIEWYSDGPIATLSLYHWLVERLGAYRDDLTDKLHEFGKSETMEYESWPETLRAWTESRGIEQSSIIGENSYNGENVLSQVIQWWSWTEEDKDGYEFQVVALQIHGGCDVRGGYTAPRIFEVEEEYALAMCADATIYCNECNASWYTDDSWHWYNDGDHKSLRETRFEKKDGFPIIETEDMTAEHHTMIESRKKAEQLASNLTLCNPGPLAPLGFVQVVDGAGICPICGKGILQAS